MGGASRYFSKVSGSGVDSTLLKKRAKDQGEGGRGVGKKGSAGRQNAECTHMAKDQTLKRFELYYVYILSTLIVKRKPPSWPILARCLADF